MKDFFFAFDLMKEEFTTNEIDQNQKKMDIYRRSLMSKRRK